MAGVAAVIGVTSGELVIANDLELQATQGRIAFFYQNIANMRAKTRTPEEYHLYTNGYLAEIEKMHAEVMEYLRRHASEAARAEAA
jgi:hypothetical protein